MTGSLAGFFVENVSVPDAEMFVVDVQRGTLDIDTETIDIWSNGIGLTPANHTTENRSLIGSRLDGFSFQYKYRLFVVPLGKTQVIADAGGSDLEVSKASNMSFQAQASPSRPPTNLAIASTIRATSVSLTSIEILGPFRLGLYGGNFTLTDGNGSSTVQTGQTDGSAGAVPRPVASRHVAREAYITVELGSMTLPLGSTVPVFLQEAGLNMTTGTIGLSNPQGTLPLDGSRIPDGARVLGLDAPVNLVLTKADNEDVSVSFLRAPASVDLDGRTIRPTGPSSSLVLFPFLAIGTVLAGAILFSRAQLGRRLHALDRLVKARQFDRALAVARRIRRLRPRQPDALVAESLSLLQTKQYAQAAGVLEEDGWTTALDPLRDYLRAMAASGQGRRSDALRWLKRCLRDAPDMVADVIANPLLADMAALAVPRRGAGQLPAGTSVHRTLGGEDALPGAS